MPVLLVLVIVLPPALLVLGLALGVAGVRWWTARAGGAGGCRRAQPQDEEAAMAALQAGCDTTVPSSTAPSSIVLPQGRKGSAVGTAAPPAFQLVASCGSLQPLSRSSDAPSEACLPLALRLAAPSPLRYSGVSQPGSPAGAAAASLHRGGLAGLALAGSASSLSPGGGDVGHRKTLSLELGQLMRAGPSAISQVMDDWDARSTLYRLMSLDALSLPSPHQQQAAAAAAGLLSPPATLFSPVAGGGGGGVGGAAPAVPMPPGEVHMDEIDLMECIGKGGYGCVYKASWRGAGVAVKYIVCPTDDADSLGRAIREVVLSKKMSHPNVVQCYSWTVLTESEAVRGGTGGTPTSRSRPASPRELSMTAGTRRRQQLTGRSSLDLLRPSSGGVVRRGLILRFNAAAIGGPLRAPSSPTLERITEALHEGRCSLAAAEMEAELRQAGAMPGGAAADTVTEEEEEVVEEEDEDEDEDEEEEEDDETTPPSASPVVVELVPPPAPASPGMLGAAVADAVVLVVPAAPQEGGSASQSPDAAVSVALAAGKPLKLALVLPGAGTPSPSSSPGIQAVHAPVGGDALSAASPSAASSASPSVGAASPVHLRADACSVEPAGLPTSPFASVALQAPPPRRSSSDSRAAPALHLQLPELAATTAVTVKPRPTQSSEDEGEDVYGRFGSYEEMAAHFQQLATQGHQGGAVDMIRTGSMRAFGDNDLAITAASSFSDVLSMSGFMLEGTASGGELSVLSMPSSPRHGAAAPSIQQILRSERGWHQYFSAPASAASSRPSTPRGAAAAMLNSMSRLARAATAAVPVGAGQQTIDLAASMPPPAWQAHRAAAEADAAAEAGSEPMAARQQQQQQRHDVTPEAGAVEPVDWSSQSSEQRSGSGASSSDSQEQQPAQQRSSQGTAAADADAAAATTALHASSRAVRHSSTVSLSAWQTAPAGTSVAAVPAAASAATAPAAAPAHHSPAPAAQSPPQPSLLPASRLGSGSVTPRLASLSNLGPSAATSPVPGGSLAVTPRAASLRAPGTMAFQLSPRALSASRATGQRRVEALREEAVAALGGGGGTGDLVHSADRLSLGSHNESFNSEEGFGSPVKQRCGGVRDVFQLEELPLSGQEALMVVVMEFCDLGSLRKALKRSAFRPSAKWPFQTTFRALLRTAQEVAKGMGYIHEFNIVHGDLKPGNVLLKTHKVDRRGYIAKVSDFGLSRPLDWGESHASVGGAWGGTAAYTAPETYAYGRLVKASDVFAFGIMLWEMFYCRDPYEGLMEGQILLGVSDGTLRPEFEDDCPEPYRRLAERCWHYDPEQRPTFEEVDRELVRIEWEFRLRRHRAASKRGSGGSAAGGSAPPSRPGSPGPRAARQLQASALAG